MLNFSFRGAIADIDETTPVEPCHPALALVIEVGETFVRVVVPEAVLGKKRDLLCVDRSIQVIGEVTESTYGPHHVAHELQLEDSGH